MKKTKEDLLKQREVLDNFAKAFIAVLNNDVDFRITEDSKAALLIEYVDHETGRHLGEIQYLRLMRDATRQIMVEHCLDSDIYQSSSEGQKLVNYDKDGNVISTTKIVGDVTGIDVL